ncbi:MAG: aminoacetone oxidase family FAD-binding enzyme [Bacilli bacterium]|nr:aminoacetone oxidase family FAD-binding enzyme [Bacilli bacterium]
MHVCIIGGGASGVFAGITIKYLDSTIDVTIIEQNNKLLKKVSKTGSGKCNIMNKNISKEFYNDFSLIEKNMTKVEIDKMLTAYGILLREGTEGRLYPYSLQAKTVCDVLTFDLQELKVKVLLNTRVTSVKKVKTGYKINDSINCDYLVFATGSKAQAETNCYELLSSLGHKITPTEPGLVPLITKEKTNQLYGIRWKVKINFKNESRTGELQFRDNGLSGICIMDASNILKENDVISIDLMPEYSINDLKQLVSERGLKFLENVFPKNLWNEIVSRSDKSTISILKTIKNLKYTVLSKRDFNEAQITLGGVSIQEITNSFESKINNNLYILGETIDVAGATGGYNLYFAWLSGYICAEDIVNKKGS